MRSRSGHQRPVWSRARLSTTGDEGRPVTTRAGAAEASNPRNQWRRVGRMPFGIDDEVVVRQVEGTSPPPGQRLGHCHLEIAGCALALEALRPGLGHPRQRVGVVHQVRRGRAPGLLGGRSCPLERSHVGLRAQDADVGRVDVVEWGGVVRGDDDDHRGVHRKHRSILADPAARCQASVVNQMSTD